MRAAITQIAARSSSSVFRNPDVLIAALAAAAFLALHASGGFATLFDAGSDNDSLMRLVQIRDLLAGQGWFDLSQYRMGPEGGFVMHWSRLVDAPIAAFLIASQAVLPDPVFAERLVLVAWPLLLFGAGMVFLLGIVRHTAGEAAILPAAIIGAAAFHFVGIFAPAALDHHNVQLVLALAVLFFVVRSPGNPRNGYLAGAGAALMLAAGMESVPLVAAAGLGVSTCFLFAGCLERRMARGFGLAFAATSTAAFLTTVPPGQWSAAHCDAFSLPQFGAAAISGLGLAAVASFHAARETRLRRLFWLSVLGIATAGLVVAAFPQCLADPYATLDPQLKRYWLSAVTEAQSITTILANKPAMALAYYATPLLGLAVLCHDMARRRMSRANLLVGLFLVTAIAVSFWQVRGAMFAIPLSAIPLAAWVGRTRRKASEGIPGATAKMAAAWLLSVNVVWSGAAGAIETATGDRGGEPGIAKGVSGCTEQSAFTALGARAPATVLAISNLGAPILRHTGHRALAGPYHRNVGGNLRALEAFMSTPDIAESIIRENNVGYVAHCPGNTETVAIAGWSPDGFLAGLDSGTVPPWLQPVVTEPGAALAIYRVLPPR